MEYKKIIIPLILAIFLLSITSVCASEIDDTIASEDTKSMELSIDEIDDDNLQTDEKNIQVADDETLSAQEDDKALSLSMNKYSNLAQEIGSGGNITLQYDYYMYDEGSTITISVADSVIDGKGAVIYMDGSNIRAFNVTASGVTFKNLTIKNANYNDYGGAIYFTGSGTVTDCNFEDNKANGEHSNGGAVYFQNNGVVRNCNFTGNTATYNGGAVFFSKNAELTNSNFIKNTATYRGGAAYIFEGTGTVLNCSFTDNTATDNRGGAVFIYYGPCTLTNCIFNGNSAKNGGAISSETNLAVAADTCIFKKDSDTTYQTRILSLTLNADNFTTVYGSGEKLTFDLKTNSSIPITNGNISISVYLKDNNTWVGNYSCISGEGWIPDLPVGSYYAIFSTEYAGAQAINRTVTVTMPDARYYINVTSLRTSDKTVNITAKSNIPKNLIWNAKLVFILPNGTEIAANYSENENWWASYTFDEYAVYEINAKYSGLDNVDVSKGNLTLVEFDSVYSSLAREIASGGDNIVLKFDHYTYDKGSTITIGHTCVIDGRGAVIDMAGSNIRAFYANVEVTIKNLTIKNVNFNGDGGAIYFNTNGHVSNCNFTGNNATGDGGAIEFGGSGSVTNCNFVNNSATGGNSWGGAINIYSGTVTNCTFTDNTATGDGGAVYFINTGNVTNCTFTDNTARYGGAVYFSTGTVANCNFTGNTAGNWGGAVHFDETGNVTNCNFTGNNATYGSAIFFNSYGYAKTISNSIFLNNLANAEALEITKNDNNITITFTGGNNLLNAIYSLDDVNFANVTYWGANGITNTDSSTPSRSKNEAGQNITVGVVVNGKVVLNEVNVTDDNGMIVLDISAGDNYYITARHDADSYYTEAEKAISNNTKFNVNVTSQTTNNKTVNITAKSNIPQDVVQGKLLFILLDGTEIEATYGGNGTWWAVHTFADYDVYQVNATYEGLDNVTITNGTISISKTPTEITVENETLELLVDDSIATGATLTPAEAGDLTFTSSNIAVAIVEDGKIIAVGEGTAIITVSFAENEDYAAAENKTITVKVIKYDSKVTIAQINDTVYPNNVTITYTIENKTNVTVSIDGVSDDKISITNDTITVIGLDAGEYTITIINNESRIYHQSNDTKTFTVNKQATSITASDVSTTYNINKDLVITLKDANGNPLTGASITVDLNGAKTYTTDKNGQVKVSTKGLAPKAYTAKVTFNGNTNYDKSTKDVKVTVKKATPKLTAKKKTFKTSVKTKKYTITLKDNTGKAIKKAKVTLKVKGKTYKATTNSKGKAVFKIKNLKKKGTFKATITYKGNKYYNKITKKANIKVIVTFKIVSKGSKDKSTVKEIQQALKDHGYYLSYKGHYLKVDGKFKGCTERSVKEFQHDKGLKVTGKVDEKTAKKLGII